MTAGLARFCISRLAVVLAAMARILAQASLLQSKKDKTIPVTASDLVGDRAEGTKDPAVVLETGSEDFDQHRFAFEAAPQHGSRWGQPGVVAQGDGRVYRARGVGMRARAKSGLPGYAERVLTRLLRQTAFGPGLQFPGEFPAQIMHVQDRAI